MKKRCLYIILLGLLILVNPVFSLCFDSDYGKYYNSFGFIEMDSSRVSEDNCFTEELLKEYYCFNDSNGTINYKFVYYDCPYGCSNGVCKNAPCNDSDNGKDYYLKGVAESGVNGRSYTDLCDESDKKVFEYYCRGDGSVGGEWFLCSNGCKEGACLKENSLCSNLGEDVLSNMYDLINSNKVVHLKEGAIIKEGEYFIAGRTITHLFKLNNFSLNINDSKIVLLDVVKETDLEYKIDNKIDFQNSLVIDNENYIIEAVSKDSIKLIWEPFLEFDNYNCNYCRDSDGGKDYFSKGSIMFNGKSYTDSCFEAGKKVFEYFCNDDGSYSTEGYNCSYGCKDGACINPSSNVVKVEKVSFFKRITGFFAKLF